MKTTKIITGIVIIACIALSFVYVGKYKNGTFRGISRSIYTSEEFYGDATLTIQDDTITNIDFRIVDSSNHEIFDENYENHYIGNEVYIQQCRDNWKAMQTFPDDLIQYQDLDSVDVISGATWACNLFKAAVSEALKEAEKMTTIQSVRDHASIRIFPNPFTSIVTVNYSLTRTCMVTLDVYNEQGSIITQPVNNCQIAGEYAVQLNDLSEPGIYLLTLRIDKKNYYSNMMKI